MRTGSPSLAIFVPSSRGVPVSLVIFVLITFSRYSLVPIGMISVFSSLNFALDPLHHFCVTPTRVSYSSSWLRDLYALQRRLPQRRCKRFNGDVEKEA
ncbi:hypothetical protein C8Q70DRAFT_1009477 [Cubamyces menziesii]|nr:hypothetical protein C8Q70DRAFT_1009477 [Cubamyces menziesii]